MYRLRIKDFGCNGVTEEFLLDTGSRDCALDSTLDIIREILVTPNFIISHVAYCVWEVLREDVFIGIFTLIRVDEEVHKDDLCDTRR